MRYYIGDDNGIPFREQPNEGYNNMLDVAKRILREVETDIKLANKPFEEVITWYTIVIHDDNGKHITTKLMEVH